MTRFVLLAAFLLKLGLFSNAQIIDNIEGISLIEENRFNANFIRTNKIAIIRGELSSKKEQDIIRPSNESVEYHFDRAGRLYQINYIRHLRNGKTDVTSTVYRFDSDGTLIDKILSDVSGATSYRYGYNDSKQVISETCSRMKSPTDTLSTTGPERTEIYTETIKHIALDNGYKLVTYNSYNVPYKEEFTYFDENGYCNSKRTRFITNNRQSSTNYKYNEHGLLSEKIIVADVATKDSLKLSYSYDEVGNLLSAEETYKGVLIRNIEFLYDPKTWILTARLAKDEETTFIRIARYETSYFD